MAHEELQDYGHDADDPDLDALDEGEDVDGDWDEETLGLDWNDADAQSLVEEVTGLRP